MLLRDPLPDYLPARMLNEFVYCPRLFFYEWVEGVFAHNRETVEGSLRHAKLDARQDALAAADELPDDQRIHSRSVTLSSDAHGLIAKMDLVEGAGGVVSPVDYKRGTPRGHRRDGTLEAWDTDQVQLAVQALVLRENGYTCEEGVIYYVTTKQRVRVPINDELVRTTLEALDQARRLAAEGQIPPPLVDSPKCPRCSLVGICLPDETRATSDEHRAAGPHRQRWLFPEDGSSREANGNAYDGSGHRNGHGNGRGGDGSSDRLTAGGTSSGDREGRIRRLVPARDDLRPLYLNTQGLRVGKSGAVLKVQEKDKVVQEVRLNEICQLNLLGNVQLSTQAVQELCQHEIPIAYFSQGGWFYGVTHGLGVKNIVLRREQFRLADVTPFCLRLSRELVAGKIRNQRTMLQRNHVEPPRGAISFLKALQDEARRAESLAQLLGIEGNAARVYFEHFSGMIKVGDPVARALENDAAAGETGEAVGPRAAADGAFDAAAESGSAAGGAAAESATAAPTAAARVRRASSDFDFDFVHRNRRPPRDPVNALLSLAYSMLAKDLTIVAHTVGFDPYLGFFHQPRFGRAALALDLMEPFRPLVADSAVLSAINTRMVTSGDFIRAGGGVSLKPDGRKAFFRAYEARMDTLVTHPLFGYRVSYRRVLEIQARLLARVLQGELAEYPVFVTR